MTDATADALDGQTVTQALHAITALFNRTRLASPALDARLLTCAACGLDEVGLITQGDLVLSTWQARDLSRMVALRLERMPVSRIVNLREFYGLPFRLSKHTLDPRPDSETLVTAALAKISPLTQRPSVLDLGTGSGCLLLAVLAHCPHAVGLGVDISAGALRMARLNAALNGLRDRAFFRQSHWFAQLTRRYELMLANPPYIRAQDLPALAPEVKDYDPVKALVADRDGLGDFVRITGQAASYLTPGGWLGLEVGQGQAEPVVELLRASGFSTVEVTADLAGIDRVVMAQKT